MIKRIFRTLILCIFCSALSGTGVWATMKYDLVSKIKKKFKGDQSITLNLDSIRKSLIREF